MRYLLPLFFLAVGFNVSAQSDGCSAATVIGVTPDCSSPTNGTTIGATQTIAGCTGNADDDVWYQFVATSTSHQIVVNGAAGFDPVVQLFSGTCASLVSLVCKDDFGDGVTETINYASLTPGNTYRIRVYHYGIGSGTGNFDICVSEAPTPPTNDDCSGATTLTVNTACVNTFATTDGASESLAGCSGFADDDVWFSFVATNSLQNILVTPLESLDLVYQVYSGTCGSLTSLACIDNTFTSQAEQEDIVGLIPGQTYFIRVYDYYQGTTGDFNICVTGTPTPTPTNDEPCNAIQLPEVTSMCQYSVFTTTGATTSAGPPTPSTCIGGGGAAIGGFQAGTQDVWFSITVPPSGNLDVTAMPNGGGGFITDGVMVLYSGTCSSLTQIVCSDDNDYPGTGNDLLPLISATGLTPGSTVFLRYFGFGTSSGDFGICASTASNDDCANALYICDINGYSASTSASYTPDRPDNMRGNNEDINGVNMPDGTNTGGIFGQGGPWGTGAPFFDVVIDNNSWIKFTASSTTATLTVSIYDCWVGNYPSGGLQMQVFEGDNCTNFVPVSNFEESSTGFTITANGLTVGNDYYLMIDGYAGDICNYTITADSGVQFPDIADVPPICIGESVTLTAPAGAVSYEWQHDGSTTQSVTVTPSTTETYYCEVTGLCDYKQLLDVVVTVNPLPNVAIANGTDISICDGTDVDLTATGASSYSWDIPASGAVVNVSPIANTTYTVTGTDGNNCSNSAAINVTVNPNPTLDVTPTAADSDCGGSNGSLTGASGTGAPTLTYTWTDGSSTIGTGSNLLNIPAGTYFLILEDGNTCTETFGPFNISNPGAPPAPTVVIDNNTPCLDGNVQLTASSTIGGATFNWTGPNGFSANTAVINLNNVTALEAGNYCVSATVAGCTGPSTCELITVLADPIVDLTVGNNDSTICLNNDFTIDASGASTYSWSGPNGFISTNASETILSASASDEGFYYVTGTDTEGCFAMDSMYITVLALPSITISADAVNNTYCGGGIANLSAAGGTSYTWTGPNGFTSTVSNPTLLDLTAAEEGYYVATATDDEMCSNIDSVFVSVVTNVPASALPDTIICPGEALILSGSGGVNFVWTGELGFSSTDQNPLVTNSAEFDNTGWYYLTVIDTNGCLGYDSTYIEVTPNEDCITIPNLITPDADGFNDTWVINGLEKFLNAEVEIYNRWGNLIYSASPYNNDWGGEVNEGATLGGNDKIVPVGTYFYIIRLNDGMDKPAFRGYIEVQH